MSAEQETRLRIDKQLAQSGWSREQGNLVEEFLLSEARKAVKDNTGPYLSSKAFNERHDVVELPQSKQNGLLDYTLMGRDGKPIAIVRAKRDNLSSENDAIQAADYADRIQIETGKSPFIFLTNGDQILFWDRDRYPARQISGYFVLDDLERLDFQRQYRQSLAQFTPSMSIIDRSYQRDAVHSITEGLEKTKRKFLLVMATGTGKTRTLIALIDLLIRAKWIERVLFLADRRELVRQARDDCKVYLPDQTIVRIEGGIRDIKASIQLATYPSMMQVYQQISAGYYDLIVADESHRSIYNRYKVLLEHFDAIQIGLTATPTDYLEHNTFELFGCPDGLPTFYYPYETAVENDYLVAYKVYEAQTHFQIEGIKAGQLPPPLQKQIEEQGLDLSEIDFEGSDLERKVTNTGTNDKLVDEFMDQCRRDARGLPSKSIIFAMTHKHALELLDSFNRRYGDLQKDGMAAVIDSQIESADKVLDDFKRKDMPRVAISVDMLDTGIDVPAIQNLVLAKPVFSQVKFWQMIGRGTRLWHDPITNDKKSDFLIIDHWGNFDYFHMNPEGTLIHPSEPLPVQLFRLRLHKLDLLRQSGEAAMVTLTLVKLKKMLKQLSDANIHIRAHGATLRKLQQDGLWSDEDITPQGTLSRVIAPLLRFLPDVNLYSILFEVHTESLAIAHLEGRQEHVDKLREQIINQVASLPVEIQEVKELEHMRTWVMTSGFWTQLDQQRILDLQEAFTPIMRFRQREQRDIIRLHLPDDMLYRRWITYGPGREIALYETYKGWVEAHLHEMVNTKELLEQVPALYKLKRNEEPTEVEIADFADRLNKPDLFITEEVLRQVYDDPNLRLRDFIRYILGEYHLPDRDERIRTTFQEFLNHHTEFTAAQVNFVLAVRAAVKLRKHVTLRELGHAPFNRLGTFEELFDKHTLSNLLQMAGELVA